MRTYLLKCTQMAFKNQSEAPIELRAAYEVQQDLAVACSLHSDVVWDVMMTISGDSADASVNKGEYKISETCVTGLGPDQFEILIKKLECMFPDDNKVYTSKPDLRKAKKYNANVKEVRVNLFRNIWKQRKYTNGALIHSIIYIIVTAELSIEKAEYSHNYTIHPVFRTRRCCKDTNSSAGCCMIFIDEKSRIYQNWNDFVNNNELPIGTMIAPKNGCYSFDKENKVELEYSLTPAYSYKTLNTVDNVISAASFVGGASAMFHPVFTLLTIGTKTYETIRDYQKMSDQIQRGTTTNLKANLSLTSNIVSLTSSVITFGAYMSVPSGGELSLTAGMTIQSINSAATLINCTKFIITTYDLFTRYFLDDEELDFNDIMEFGSSLILLTNSINNIVITSQIGKVGGNTLKNLLQTQIKAGLTLLSGEAMKYAAQDAGNFDLLRLVNDIPYKNVLCNIHTVYTNLKQTGFLSSLSILGAGAMEVVPGLLVKVDNKEITEYNLLELSKHYGLKFVKHIVDSQNLIDILNSMGGYFSATVVQFFLNQTRTFIDTTVDAIDSQQSTFVTTEMILYKMFAYVIKNYKNYTYEFLDMKRDDILSGVTQFFKSLNPNATDNSKKYNCNICGGYYNLVNI